MIDLFTIFSKGGLVLWCFQGTSQSFTSSVNALIKSVILQERGSLDSFTHGSLALKYKLDNEFELVFVIAYQKFLQLSYVDKFLNDIQIEFRDRYKDVLLHHNLSGNYDAFSQVFQQMLSQAEEISKIEAKAPRPMRKFEDSEKSKKTVASMIENRKDDQTKRGGKKKNKTTGKGEATVTKELMDNAQSSAAETGVMASTNGDLDEAKLAANRQNFFNKMTGKKKVGEKNGKSPEVVKKKGKESRVWANGGTSKDMHQLDFSKCRDVNAEVIEADDSSLIEHESVGKFGGEIQDMESDTEEEEESDDMTEQEVVSKNNNNTKSGGGFRFLSSLRNLVGSKVLTRDDLQPVLDKMRELLVAKNVAAEISEKLCESVATKLQGKSIGTFKTIAATVKQSLNEACVQILSPRRRVNILRDAMEAKQQRRPYVITFCGVNGVGKSTNLAKICFWLVENDFRVAIAACDTFRAGAVEQLRTHCRKLNALHPVAAHKDLRMVHLYEKGYGKDAAGIAMEAINFARDGGYDVVLVDTAGRMQDNEPLMKALAKLIKVNQPDLVLFVGEALVGNEAVDQLVKFNQALADNSHMANPHLIDGIVLTKFDTVDDKVGAAISMTYITGQPIVFVGTGQMYTDLKNLNARAVVHALLK